jgi:hypothetical protein
MHPRSGDRRAADPAAQHVVIWRSRADQRPSTYRVGQDGQDEIWVRDVIGSATAGVLIGILVKWLADLFTEHRRHRNERELRLQQLKIEAYAQLFAGLDDLCDDRSQRDKLEAKDDGPDRDAALAALELQISEHNALLNRAVATVDLLAPQNICDLATAADEVSMLALDHPDRVMAIENLTTACRADLQVSDRAWKQSLGSART